MPTQVSRDTPHGTASAATTVLIVCAATRMCAAMLLRATGLLPELAGGAACNQRVHQTAPSFYDLLMFSRTDRQISATCMAHTVDSRSMSCITQTCNCCNMEKVALQCAAWSMPRPQPGQKLSRGAGAGYKALGWQTCFLRLEGVALAKRRSAVG